MINIVKELLGIGVLGLLVMSVMTVLVYSV